MMNYEGYKVLVWADNGNEGWLNKDLDDTTHDIDDAVKYDSIPDAQNAADTFLSSHEDVAITADVFMYEWKVKEID